MTRELAESLCSDWGTPPDFDSVAFLRSLKKVTFYADTSWWVAFKNTRDPHHSKAMSLWDINESAAVLWTPWHRVEVFNAIR